MRLTLIKGANKKPNQWLLSLRNLADNDQEGHLLRKKRMRYNLISVKYYFMNVNKFLA